MMFAALFRVTFNYIMLRPDTVNSLKCYNIIKGRDIGPGW